MSSFFWAGSEPQKVIANLSKTIEVIFFMLALIRRASFLFTFYGLYFNSSYILKITNFLLDLWGQFPSMYCITILLLWLVGTPQASVSLYCAWIPHMTMSDSLIRYFNKNMLCMFLKYGKNWMSGVWFVLNINFVISLSYVTVIWVFDCWLNIKLKKLMCLLGDTIIINCGQDSKYSSMRPPLWWVVIPP